MSAQNYSQKLAQRYGEDAAYTFKGLYKTSDWLEWKFRSYLFFPFALSLFVLVFQNSKIELALKILAFFSLIFTVLAFINDKQYRKLDEEVNKYRILANQFKDVYNEAETAFYNSDSLKLDEIPDKLKELRQETSKLPITLMGRILSKLMIKHEMNLGWIYKNE